MIPYNLFNRNINSHNAVWATPQEFMDDIQEYIKSCQYYKYEKLRVEGSDELEKLDNIQGEPIVKWHKVPSVSDFCRVKNILPETYYNQGNRKDPMYRQVIAYFKNVRQAAAEDCLADSKMYRGGVYALNDKERVEKSKQARIENKNKNEKAELDIELAKAKVELVKEQTEQIKSGKAVDPYISTFFADIINSSNNDNK